MQVSPHTQLVVIREFVERTNRSNNRVHIVEVTVGASADGVGVNSIDTCKDLGRVETTVEGEHLATDLFAGRLSAVHDLVEEVGLDGVLGFVHQVLIDVVTQTSEGAGHLEAQVVEADRVASGLDTKETSVAILSVERNDGSGAVELGALTDERRGGVAHGLGVLVHAAEHSLDDHQWVGIRISITSGREGVSDVGLIQVIKADANIGSGELGRLQVRFNSVGRTDRDAAKHIGSKLDQLGVLEVTTASDDHTRGGVVGGQIFKDVFASDFLDVFDGTQDGATQSGSSVCRLMETIEDDFLQVGVDRLELGDDGVALSIDSGLGDLGVEHDVRQDVHGLGKIVLHASVIESSLFSGGVCVQVTAHLFDLELKSLAGALLCALEEEVLGKVGNTVVLSSLVTRTGIYPQTDGSGLTRALLGSNTKTVVEDSDLRLWVSQGSIDGSLRGRHEAALGEGTL